MMETTQIEKRAHIYWNVDAVECGRCGCFAVDGESVIQNPNWFIDSHLDDSGTEIADIYCPQCW